jgi:hypothetical protein
MPSVWHAEPSFLIGMGGSPCRQDVDRAPSPDGDRVDVARRRASKPGTPAFARLNSAAGRRRRDRGGHLVRIEAGSTGFYPATLALALVWTVGGFAFGPLHLGRTAATRTLCFSAWDLPGCSCWVGWWSARSLPGGAGQHGPRPCRPGLGTAAGPDHGSEPSRRRAFLPWRRPRGHSRHPVAGHHRGVRAGHLRDGQRDRWPPPLCCSGSSSGSSGERPAGSSRRCSPTSDGRWPCTSRCRCCSAD